MFAARTVITCYIASNAGAAVNMNCSIHDAGQRLRTQDSWGPPYSEINVCRLTYFCKCTFWFNLIQFKVLRKIGEQIDKLGVPKVDGKTRMPYASNVLLHHWTSAYNSCWTSMPATVQFNLLGSRMGVPVWCGRQAAHNP
jgi:hypothetical protein